jgi:hypothetical protein
MKKKNKVLCFDLDNIICKTVKSNYKKSTPNIDVIELINNLYKKKYTIKIFTARYMGRFMENEKIVKKKFYNETFYYLKSWNLNFHKLILGKPSFDVYIDDKNFNFKKNWVVAFKKRYLY